ncbi:MAG: hypothetical protein JWN75_481 [Candidatus Saccharibacteria bacterium]|nr:hypothetical protein [Candidatus Saccharibacteria bacterium]
MKIVERLFLAYLLLKPFYLFDSGGLQIGDLFLLIAFALFIAISKFNKKSKKELVETIKSNKLFIIFTGLTLVINSMYFAYYGMSKFLMSSLYYIFIFFAIALFSVLGKNKSFLVSVSKVLKFGLIAQLAISLLGIGRDYGIDRYMGTFNDPNQFGFYILISYLFIYAINIVLSNNKKIDTPFLLMTLYLIFQSASTGSLLGITIFIILQIAYSMKDVFRISYKKVRTIMISLGVGLVVMAAGAVLVSNGALASINPAIDQFAADQTVANRVSGKISKADNEADITIWEDRGYDIIYKYPQYIPFGAGEGNYDRYVKATNNYGNEIHATLPSMLFYYGIIPFLIIIGWFYGKAKNVDKRILIVYIALFAESFILLNQRQSLFWMIFVLGGLYFTTKGFHKRDKSYE